MTKRITYKSSGVDIDKANFFLKSVAKNIGSTLNASVLKRKGSFGALFELPRKGYKNPVLVSSTDGVGTKLLLAKLANKHDTVGIDLVAMNVNDILCVGAKPLFFLDYIACGRLDPKVLKSVMKGIVNGCRISKCSLIGGETAEMPGLYKDDEYDLAGFVVGIVDKQKIIDGAQIKPGDCVIGLPSSGLHSNGFSLARKVYTSAEQKRLAPELLKPTRIYVKEVLPLVERFKIKGIAHLTGGAFYEKLTKILPKGACFQIYKDSWPVGKVFQNIAKKGRIQAAEMYRTFNMGIGLAIVVAPNDLSSVTSFLKKKRVTHYRIGEVVRDSKRKVEFI